MHTLIAVLMAIISVIFTIGSTRAEDWKGTAKSSNCANTAYVVVNNNYGVHVEIYWDKKATKVFGPKHLSEPEKLKDLRLGTLYVSNDGKDIVVFAILRDRHLHLTFWAADPRQKIACWFQFTAKSRS